MRRPNGYWTFTRCKRAALKFKTRKEFILGEKGAYLKARRKGWLKKICAHMVSPFARRNKDICIKAASKCKTLSEFIKKHSTCYKACLENGWQSVYAHLPSKNKKFQYWHDLSRLQKEALKYSNRTDFQNKSKSAYCAAHRLGLLDKICKHMKKQGNLQKRALYAYEFPGNVVYVGLTYSYKMRHYHHVNDDLFLGLFLKDKNYKYIKLNKFYDKDIAGRKEDRLMNDYIKRGWLVINRAKGGSLGGSKVKWNFTACKKEALKYELYSDFRTKSVGAYIAARKNGWLSLITKHLIKTRSRAYQN